MSKDRIKASDIFDPNVSIAYREFITLNQLSDDAVKQLKRELIKLNNL